MQKTVTNPKRLWTILFIVVVILIGLALRVWFVSVNELDPANSPADDGDYYQRALRFATTGQYIDDFWLIRPPLHVFLFALMIRTSIILGNVPPLPLIRGAQMLLSLLAIPIGYDLARRLFGQRSGRVFAVILAVWYPLVELPAHLFTEPLFIALLLMHFWLLIYWRDQQRWLLLALSALMLGLTSLTRSVGLYGALFVVPFLLFATCKAQSATCKTQNAEQKVQNIGQRASDALRIIALFLIPFSLVILPWTIRNYVVYERFILVDTIGSVNLWLHMEKYEEKGVEMLKQMPQRDRHVFSTKDVKRMVFEDPIHFWNMLWRNAWLHFLHIWKAQFIEDFLLKMSFYGRPLRDVWILGVFGDVVWFVFTLAGLAALVAPMREGAFRIVAIGWVVYTMLTIMIFHLEPRYLMPLWLVLALYSSWILGYPCKTLAMLRQQLGYGVLAAAITMTFLTICFTYRDYPSIIATGIKRESHRVAGMHAFAVGDYDTAVREFQAMVDADPVFVSSSAELALAQLAQGNIASAQHLAGKSDAQHMLIARGAIAQAQGKEQDAAKLLTQAEKKSGDDVLRMTRFWLQHPPRNSLVLGNGQDFGFIEGFSLAEKTTRTYRWLQGKGDIVLPLPQPLQAESILALTLASGQPKAVPLHIQLTAADGTTYCLPTIQVASGEWRVYRLPLPERLSVQPTLHMTLSAPIFIPAHLQPGSNDVRPLSLMMNALRVNGYEVR